MRIMIKSELDSRPLLYPLIRSLFNHGSILVITTNKYLSRLIDGEVEGGFRNVRIIVDEDGAVDDIREEYGIAPGDFDFEIMDNVGAIDYDLLLIPISNHISESFRYEIEPTLDLDTTSVIRFGTKAKTSAKKAPSRKDKPTEEEQANYDPRSKWKRKSEEDIIIEKLSGDGQWAPFPTFQDIETLEASYVFYTVDRNLAMILYKILGPYLNIDERFFVKEVTARDENSGHISGTDIG